MGSSLQGRFFPAMELGETWGRIKWKKAVAFLKKSDRFLKIAVYTCGNDKAQGLP